MANTSKTSKTSKTVRVYGEVKLPKKLTRAEFEKIKNKSEKKKK